MNLSAIKKFVNYIKVAFKISLLTEFTYLSNFVVNLLSEIMISAYFLIFIETIFLNFDEFFGYNRYEMILIWAIAYLTSLMMSDIMQNLNSLPYEIMEGTLDRLLMKPINIFIPLLFRRFRLIKSITMIVPIAAIYLVLPYIELHINAETIALLVYTLILMALFLITSSIFIYSLSFWFGQTGTYYWIYFSLSDISHLPMNSIKGTMGAIFNKIYPITLMGSVPAAILLNRVPDDAIFYVTIAVIVWCFITYFIWNLGLRSYTSANATGGMSE